MIGPGRISRSLIRAEDWVHSWKRHFKPWAPGPSLLVRPSWSRLRPRRGQAVMTLDPGLSFGTGQHATTRFCLEEIVARRDRIKHILHIRMLLLRRREWIIRV